MFLAKIYNNLHPKKEDIEEIMDYLFQEIRDTTAIDIRKIPFGDYEMIREDVYWEFRDFMEKLEDIEEAGDPVSENFEEYRTGLRVAASTLFNTIQLIEIFGLNRANYLEEQLYRVYLLYRHLVIPRFLFEREKLQYLLRLEKEGKLDSTRDRKLLQRIRNYFAKRMKSMEKCSEGDG